MDLVYTETSMGNTSTIVCWHTDRQSNVLNHGAPWYGWNIANVGLKHQSIRVITKLPNSEQSYKGKVKTHNYINRQNQSTTGKLWKP
jgi:hypothetical protein